MKLTAPHVALLLLVLLGSCASAKSRGSQQPAGTLVGELPGDPDVESRLESLELRTARDGTSRSLEFVLRNKSTENLSFAWALEWYDRGGKRVAANETVWTPTTLGAGASVPVKAPMPADAQSSRLRAIRS
jgi:uncharacterized protein YcfL